MFHRFNCVCVNVCSHAWELNVPVVKELQVSVIKYTNGSKWFLIAQSLNMSLEVEVWISCKHAQAAYHPKIRWQKIIYILLFSYGALNWPKVTLKMCFIILASNKCCSSDLSENYEKNEHQISILESFLNENVALPLQAYYFKYLTVFLISLGKNKRLLSKTLQNRTGPRYILHCITYIFLLFDFGVTFYEIHWL